MFQVAACALLAVASGIALVGIPWLSQRHPGLPIDEVLAQGTGRVRITSPITLLTSPSLILEHGIVSVAPNQAAQATTKSGLLLLIAGGSADLVLEDAVLSLERVQAAAAGSSSRSPLVETLAKAAFASLTLKNCQVRIKRPGAREEALSNINAEIINDRDTSLEVKGQLEFRGEPLAYEATLGSQASNTQKDELPLDLRLTGKHIEAAINGKLVVSQALHLVARNADVQMASLAATANWLGGNWPEISGLAPMHISGPLDWLGDTIAFNDARIELSDQKGTGSLSITAGARRPQIEGTVAFDSLDVARFLTKAAAGPSTVARDATASDASPQWNIEHFLPNDLSHTLLHQIDADLRISAARVTDGDVVLGRGAGSITIKSGVANAAFAEIERDDGGTGNVVIEVDANGNVPSYKLHGRMASFEMSTLMTTLFGYPAMTGRAEIDADLSATGITNGQIRESLGGKINISGSSDVSIATDLLWLIRKTGNQPRAGWPSASGTGQTRLDTFSTRVEASRGRLKVNSFEGLVGAQTIRGTGIADLGLRTIDLEIEVHTPPTARTALKAGAATVKSINVQGAWPNPTVRITAPPSKRSGVPDPEPSKPPRKLANFPGKPQ